MSTRSALSPDPTCFTSGIHRLCKTSSSPFSYNCPTNKAARLFNDCVRTWGTARPVCMILRACSFFSASRRASYRTARSCQPYFTDQLLNVPKEHVGANFPSLLSYSRKSARRERPGPMRKKSFAARTALLDSPFCRSPINSSISLMDCDRFFFLWLLPFNSYPYLHTRRIREWH